MNDVKTTQIDEFIFFVSCVMKYEKIRTGISEKREKVSAEAVPTEEKEYTVEEIFFNREDE